MARRGSSPDGPQLQTLLTRLTSDPGYAAGTRKFAPPITDDEAAAVAAGLAAGLELALKKRGDEAKKCGINVACARGCNACCDEPIIVYLPEALVIARWLARPEQSAVLAAFLEAYPVWKAAQGDHPEHLETLNADDSRRAEYEAAYRTHWNLRVMCAFNHDGACSIYPVRPLLCREGNAIDASTHCQAGSNPPARRLTGGPVESLMKQAASLIRAAHNALDETPPNRGEMLCAQVHHLVTEGRLAD